MTGFAVEFCIIEGKIMQKIVNKYLFLLPNEIFFCIMLKNVKNNSFTLLLKGRNKDELYKHEQGRASQRKGKPAEGI